MTVLTPHPPILNLGPPSSLYPQISSLSRPTRPLPTLPLTSAPLPHCDDVRKAFASSVPITHAPQPHQIGLWYERAPRHTCAPFKSIFPHQGGIKGLFHQRLCFKDLICVCSPSPGPGEVSSGCHSKRRQPGKEEHSAGLHEAFRTSHRKKLLDP